MKKLKGVLRRIPRWTRAMFNLFLIVILVLMGYVFCGCPAFSPEQQFRREEKANLTGPATILDTISVEDSSYLYPCDELIIGESAHGVTLFCYNSKNLKQNTITYCEKTEEVTVLAVPGGNVEPETVGSVPILVFDKLPEATYAYLEMKLNVQQDGIVFQKVYELVAERRADGYFLFRLTGGTEQEEYAIWLFTRRFDDDNYGRYVGVDVSATIRFYDRENSLLSQLLIKI